MLLLLLLYLLYLLVLCLPVVTSTAAPTAAALAAAAALSLSSQPQPPPDAGRAASHSPANSCWHLRSAVSLRHLPLNSPLWLGLPILDAPQILLPLLLALLTAGPVLHCPVLCARAGPLFARRGRCVALLLLLLLSLLRAAAALQCSTGQPGQTLVAGCASDSRARTISQEPPPAARSSPMADAVASPARRTGHRCNLPLALLLSTSATTILPNNSLLIVLVTNKSTSET